MPSDIIKACGENPTPWKQIQEHPNEVEGAQIRRCHFSVWSECAFS